jgi:large subunit ribosomal protein L21
MFAIIQSGGKQFKVSEGDQISVEKLPQKAGEKVAFEVLLFSDGSDLKIGTPVLENYLVEAKVLAHRKTDKVRVFKFKSKKRYQRNLSHRQNLCDVEIVKIAAGKSSVKLATKTAAKKPAEKSIEKSTATKSSKKEIATDSKKNVGKSAVKNSKKPAPAKSKTTDLKSKESVKKIQTKKTAAKKSVTKKV